MAVDADGLAPRISSRTKIPSIRAREAAEVLTPGPSTVTSVRKKRTVHRGTATTPTTGSTVTGFSAVSLSPKTERAVRNEEEEEERGEDRGDDHGEEILGEQVGALLEERVEEEKEPEPVFCVCRGPDDGLRPMIQCDHCDDWFHYTCVKVREAQVQLIGEYVELVDEKSSGEEKYGGGLVMRGRVYLAPYALEDVSANIWKCHRDNFYCPLCIAESGGKLKITRMTDISYIGGGATPPYARAESVARQASVPREPSQPLSPVASPVPSLYFSHSPREASLPLPDAQEGVPAQVLKLTLAHRESVRLAPAPPGRSRHQSPPVASTSRRPPLSLLPVSSRKRKSAPSSKKQRLARDSSPEPNMMAENRPTSRKRSDAVEEREDQHVGKKRKASMNGSSKRDGREGKASNRRHNEREAEVYDSPSHPTDSRRMKGKGKMTMTEHERDVRGDVRYDSYASEGVSKDGLKSVPRKGKRKEKDADEHSSAEHGRRIVGGGGKDTTGDEDAPQRKRKPMVSPKAPAATIAKRRPAPAKSRPTAPKASTSTLPATLTSEEIEAQKQTPIPGPSESAVRIHCLGKLQAAFVNVFMAYFHAMTYGKRVRTVVVPGADARGTINPAQIMNGDFMEVDPPIRITEPIVLDDDDAPFTASTTGNGKPLEATDSGIFNPVSSSIEIVTGPNSSQQSVQHLPNGQASQVSVAEANNAVVEARDPTVVKNDAVTYAKEVEEALFDKLREFSRERRCWQAGAAYKQQYNLIISSLEGDLRQDLRMGFATRRISPSDLASMNSTDLASEERLKEMKQYEKEALKSLVRIDDAIPAKPLVHGGAEIDGSAEANVVIAETIDVDSVVDLEEPRVARRHATISQSIFLNGSAQSNVLDQTITSSASAYFPLYPMSPGGGDGPSGLGHSASTDDYPRRLSPIGIVDQNDAAYYSVQRGHAMPDVERASSQKLPASAGTEDREHFESLISRYYDGKGGDPGSLQQTGHRYANLESTGVEESSGKRIVWRGEILNPADAAHPNVKVIARQGGGPDYSSYPDVWTLLNPSSQITLAGRVPTQASIDYLEKNQLTNGRELIVVVFIPAEDDPVNRANFEALFEFHRNRDRHGVATPYGKLEGAPRGAAREMYLVPVRPDESYDFLDLMHTSSLPRARTENMLLGIYLLDSTDQGIFPAHVLRNRLPSPPAPATRSGSASGHTPGLPFASQNGMASPVIADIGPYV